jgi:phosphate uptake regulator
MTELEPRRLIKFGNSSFIVSLPKEWVSKNNLKKGDWVYLKETNENEIILMPKEGRNSAEIEKKIEINVTDKDDEDLKREITSAYINNFNTIVIAGKDLKQKSECVKEIIAPLTGIEILEQSAKEIIIKDFLSFETMSPRKIIRRLDNSIRAIFEEMGEGIRSNKLNNGFLNEVLEEDKGINKLYLLILKLTKIGISNREAIKSFGMSYEELSSAQWLAMNMEYLGDDLKRIARFLAKAKLNAKQKECFENNIHLIESCFIKAMTAYHKGEFGLAREVMGKKKTVLKEIDRLCQLGNDVLAGNIAERMKMVYSHVYNISKLIIY